LLILTGGTISMVHDAKTGVLRTADAATFQHFIPELFTSAIHTDMYPFDPLIDSCDVNPPLWSKLAHTISDQYEDYDGFVVLHGTDTMAYSASALSFMLENLSKPVVFTGSQLPIGILRSDAKENLLTAIEIAAAKREDGTAMVPEVTIYFGDKLFRANRTTKRNAAQFDAFKSHNCEPLAKAGVHITYATQLIHYPKADMPLRLRTKIDQNIAILKLFPGISEKIVQAILHADGLRAVVLETFGTGNAASDQWLHEALKEATKRGIIIVNKTQCPIGSVEMGRYQTSMNLLDAGVISGYDITTEALVGKLMYLLGGNEGNTERVKQALQTNLCGEITL